MCGSPLWVVVKYFAVVVSAAAVIQKMNVFVSLSVF